jgi:hypothetical protein
MAIPTSLRTRTIQARFEEALANYDPMTYFAGVLAPGQQPSSLVSALRNLSKSRLGRWAEVVRREPNVERWAAFFDHELDRLEKDENEKLRAFSGGVRAWYQRLTSGADGMDPVVDALMARLGVDPSLSSGERQTLGVTAFRFMFWRLWKEKETR